MRRSVIFALTLVALAAAGPAATKDGAKARLLSPLAISAKAGTVIGVKWTVESRNASGKAVPFGATGMFVKLIGRSGASTTATSSQTHGPPYSVRVRVPPGGIRSIRLGLHSWASTPTGDHSAPWFFPITNNPLRP